MKSRTYTGWAVQLNAAGRPAVLASVQHFGASVPNCAVVQHAIFETQAKAALALSRTNSCSPFIVKLVKVKIKFEVIE